MSGSTMFLIVVTVFFLVSFFFLPPFLPLPSLLHCGAVQILRGEGKEIELVDVSIATRSHEFYGKWDDEGKWQDSPFTAALRKFQSEGEKAGGLQVVYIKGDVTLFIAEDLKNQVASKDVSNVSPFSQRQCILMLHTFVSHQSLSLSLIYCLSAPPSTYPFLCRSCSFQMIPS
mmetsp:Transcript_49846/g.128251  ORF Transcript_49846/g.128251 Transcript_49846/m.128251 type:complete len:173 (+) Transcript_49846:958-1476(+)